MLGIISTAVIGAIIAAYVIFTVINILKRNKKGGCIGCDGKCGGCVKYKNK